jgi:hypothetical protein
MLKMIQKKKDSRMKQQTKHVRFYLLSLGIFCSLFTGCIKYHKMVPEEFPQGKEHKRDLSGAQEDIKEAKVYNHFSTKAHFDVMFFSTKVRRTHNEVYCQKHGLVGEKRIEFIRDREIELKNKLVFYVLADVREREKKELHKKKSHWNMYLDLKHHKVVPSKIEEVTLSPELTHLFGTNHSHFKDSYRVEFDVEHRQDLISEIAEQKNFSFVFDSVDRKAEIAWNKKSKRKSIYETHYWI